MSDLLELTEFLQGYVARISPAANNIAKSIALAIIQDLAVSTPVDTGTALSNWQVSFDGSVGIIPAYSPSLRGKGDPSVTRVDNAADMINAAVAIIESKQSGMTIYITNNVPYIQYLNEGSSQQSPGGFVDRANIIAKQILDNAKI